MRVVVQSELVANEPAPAPFRRSACGRGAGLAAAVRGALVHRDARVVLVHSTKRSKLRLAAAMDHLVDGPDGTDDLGPRPHRTWAE